MRRILILCYDFPPRGATGVIRITKFVRYLPEFGWQPVVVAAAVKGGMRDDSLLAQLPRDLEVIRIENPFAPASGGLEAHSAQPTWKARLRRRMRRLFIPDPQILWAPFAVQTAVKRINEGDIAALLTTAPPYSVHMAGLWLKRRFPTIPWLMDLRDIWSENPEIPDVLTYKLQRACERACLNAADQITTATDGQRCLIQDQFGVPDARIVTITNGYDSADLSPNAPPPNHHPLRITHVGSIIGNRAAATRGLWVALDRLVARGLTADDLQVRLVGVFAPEIYAWTEVLVARGVVQLAPFVPQAEAYAEMAAADVLLLLTSDDREGRLSQPNKLFEYFAMNRPVLAITPPGDVARLVREADAGVTVAPRDVDGIVAAITMLLDQHHNGALNRMAADGRFARFERRELTRQLAARLDVLVARHA